MTTKLWLSFILLLLISALLFAFINSGHQYKCYLPSRGYFFIHWDEKKGKIELLNWQPKGNIKQAPKNMHAIHNENKESEEKPEKVFKWTTSAETSPEPQNMIIIHNEKKDENK
ncbi:MAG: hypothetical protein ABII88_10190 [Candidatus Omnitrophota bacterium]